MAHTTFFYLLDRNGKVTYVLPHHIQPSVLTEGVTKLMK